MRTNSPVHKAEINPKAARRLRKIVARIIAEQAAKEIVVAEIKKVAKKFEKKKKLEK